MRALTALKTGMEPGGIVKWWPKLRSMVLAWLMKKVESWENERERAIVDAHIGRTLMKHLNSSTWVTVQSLHRLFVLDSGSVTTAALSKNLQKQNGNKCTNYFLLGITILAHFYYLLTIHYCHIKTKIMF